MCYGHSLCLSRTFVFVVYQSTTAEGLPVSIRRAAKFLGVSTSTVWRAIRKTRQRA
jgi:transposase